MNNHDLQHVKKVKVFFSFWSQCYDNSGRADEDYYYPYINNLPKKDSLSKLWHWKMGVHFSNKNCQRALKKMEEKKEQIMNYRNSNPTIDDLYKFAKTVFADGIVYSTFLVHICKPAECPIFDQHVYRSYKFLTTEKNIKAPNGKDDYFDYRKFVFGIHKNYKVDLRELDKAFMAFGQFLINPKKFINKNFKFL